MAHNEIKADSQAKFIIEGLKMNTTLKTLNMVGCSITDEDIHMIQNSTSTCNIVCDIHPLSQFFLATNHIQVYS